VTSHTDKQGKEIEDLYAQIIELERKNKELSKQIQVNESLYRNVLDALPINIYLENREGHTVFANKQVCQVNGRNLEDLYGKTVFDFFSQPIAQINRDFDLEVWKQRQLITKELLASFQGEDHHMYTGKTIIHIDESGDDYLLGFGLDITDRVKTEELLRESEEKFRSVIEQAADCIFLISKDGTIIDVNPTACESLHYSKSELLQMKIDKVFTSLCSDKLTKLDEKVNALSNFEEMLNGRGKHNIPVDVNIRLIKIGKKQMYLAICRDISDKKRAEAQIKHMAYHDALTNLPNRWYIQTYLQDYLENTETNTADLGLILLDLDRFKVINDNLGHDAGDLLLKEVSARLQLATGKRETFLARFGGDEFILLVPKLVNKEEIFRICENITEVLRDSFEIFGQKFTISASIGISLYPKDGKDLNTLIKNADLAMYDTKEKGRNGYRFFTHTLTHQAMERLD
jgi:diguanylate cyclase (GGDEF)-like protein/PAS domain S-box-containing protein